MIIGGFQRDELWLLWIKGKTKYVLTEKRFFFNAYYRN